MLGAGGAPAKCPTGGAASAGGAGGAPAKYPIGGASVFVFHCRCRRMRVLPDAPPPSCRTIPFVTSTMSGAI